MPAHFCLLSAVVSRSRSHHGRWKRQARNLPAQHGGDIALKLDGHMKQLSLGRTVRVTGNVARSRVHITRQRDVRAALAYGRAPWPSRWQTGCSSINPLSRARSSFVDLRLLCVGNEMLAGAFLSMINIPCCHDKPNRLPPKRTFQGVIIKRFVGEDSVHRETPFDHSDEHHLILPELARDGSLLSRCVTPQDNDELTLVRGVSNRRPSSFECC